MKRKTLHKTLSMLIALVWLINGLFCKVLNWVPRHEQIVARILGETHSRTLTFLIGISEIVMTVWILSKFKPKFNAIVQIVIIGVMNILEFVLVPDLLLWGRWNAVFALLFMGVIYYNEFVLSKQIISKTTK